MTTAHLRTATAGATDVGRRRSGNEDSYEIWVADEIGRDHVADTLLVVCDGMGGSNAGEVASRMAVEAVVRVFAEDQGQDPVAALTKAIETANAEVHEHSRSRADLSGMGTTCTAVALRGQELFVAHVGDSRAYRVRGGQLKQLTQDHSLVAQLVARGQITAADARTDPRRNVVTRSVGVGPEVEVDALEIPDPMRPGDTIVICSDGLHGQVTDDEIAEIGSEESLEQACQNLIELANARGGPDNITVAMARLEGDDPGAEAAPAPARVAGTAAPRARTGGSRQRALRMLIVMLIMLVLALAGIAWAVFGLVRTRGGAPTTARHARASEERLAWR